MSSLVIDLRSDTVTKPTASMREAMLNAEVGDDVYGDDPTVIKLQEMAAKLLGKQSALFVPSGTMGNLISVLIHCSSFGSEMILGDECHIHMAEQGGCSTIGRIHCRTVPTQSDGTLRLEDIEERIRISNDDVHYPRTKLVCLENTHNRMGGKVLSIEYIESVAQLCRKYGLKLHMDGARLMNAAVEFNVNPEDLVKSCDSISFCLSKGLAAPVGSLIIGNEEFIHEARRMRKVLGGGMRQAGILAAAGIISLTEMPKLLKFDHENAKRLALGLSEIFGCEINPSTDVQTNIVFFRLNPSQLSINAPTLVQLLKDQHGILISNQGSQKIRCLTHYMITKENIDHVIEIMKNILEKYRIFIA